MDAERHGQGGDGSVDYHRDHHRLRQSLRQRGNSGRFQRLVYSPLNRVRLNEAILAIELIDDEGHNN